MPQRYLYVIAPKTHLDGPVKIGISGDPHRRLRQLQTGHAEPLTVYHSEPVPADRARLFERLLHRDLGYLKSHGEWFKIPVNQAIQHVQFTLIQYADSELSF